MRRELKVCRRSLALEYGLISPWLSLLFIETSFVDEPHSATFGWLHQLGHCSQGGMQQRMPDSQDYSAAIWYCFSNRLSLFENALPFLLECELKKWAVLSACSSNCFIILVERRKESVSLPKPTVPEVFNVFDTGRGDNWAQIIVLYWNLPSEAELWGCLRAKASTWKASVAPGDNKKFEVTAGGKRRMEFLTLPFGEHWPKCRLNGLVGGNCVNLLPA